MSSNSSSTRCLGVIDLYDYLNPNLQNDTIEFLARDKKLGYDITNMIKEIYLKNWQTRYLNNNSANAFYYANDNMFVTSVHGRDYRHPGENGIHIDFLSESAKGNLDDHVCEFYDIVFGSSYCNVYVEEYNILTNYVDGDGKINVSTSNGVDKVWVYLYIDHCHIESVHIYEKDLTDVIRIVQAHLTSFADGNEATMIDALSMI